MEKEELRNMLIEYKESHGCTWKWMAKEMFLGYKTLTNFTSGYRDRVTKTTEDAIVRFLETH